MRLDKGTRCESGTAPQRYQGTKVVTKHWAPAWEAAAGRRVRPTHALESEDLPAVRPAPAWRR
ncbi:hypothetical protein GCM10028864_60300 [Microlunatus parietis]